MNEYLFSYGTLQKGAVQLKVLGRLLDGSADLLKGYRLASIDVKDEIFFSKGEERRQLTLVGSDHEDSVEGTVFEVLEEELRTVDQYEPSEYKRVGIILESGKRAWAYMAIL